MEEKEIEKEEQTEEKEKSILEELKEKTDKAIKNFVSQPLTNENIDYIYKLIDINKDIANINYWQNKEEYMRYRGYSDGEYSESSYGRRGVPGTGRYSESGSYGRRRRDSRGRYRGEEMEDMMDEMKYHYGNYSESGNYGAEKDTMESLSELMESGYEYFKALKENANSQDEIKMMEHYFKKMSQI